MRQKVGEGVLREGGRKKEGQNKAGPERLNFCNANIIKLGTQRHPLSRAGPVLPTPLPATSLPGTAPARHYPQAVKALT